MNTLIAPSLLSANFANLEKECTDLETAGIRWLHLDIMDGNYVPNITFGQPVIGALRKFTRLFFDVHLMIEDPGRYIESFARSGADLLVPHIEAMCHPQRVLAQIRDLGVKAGIALNPDTDPARLKWLLPDLDLILIMGVNPGFSGQKFLSRTIEKIRDCRSFLKSEGYADLPIEVDGGANPENAPQLVNAGANVLVSGSAFFCGLDYQNTLKRFRENLFTAHPDEATRKAYAIVNEWNQ